MRGKDVSAKFCDETQTLVGHISGDVEVKEVSVSVGHFETYDSILPDEIMAPDIIMNPLVTTAWEYR